ncbi:hypothetical protein L9F63_010145, partial [Diploptera punctata]
SLLFIYFWYVINCTFGHFFTILLCTILNFLVNCTYLLHIRVYHHFYISLD